MMSVPLRCFSCVAEMCCRDCIQLETTSTRNHSRNQTTSTQKPTRIQIKVSLSLAPLLSLSHQAPHPPLSPLKVRLLAFLPVPLVNTNHLVNHSESCEDLSEKPKTGEFARAARATICFQNFSIKFWMRKGIFHCALVALFLWHMYVYIYRYIYMYIYIYIYIHI